MILLHQIVDVDYKSQLIILSKLVLFHFFLKHQRGQNSLNVMGTRSELTTYICLNIQMIFECDTLKGHKYYKIKQTSIFSESLVLLVF